VSLIDDALKRAQAADEAAARTADRPWTPTPMPDPAIARRRAIARWAGILAAVAVAAALGAWLVARIAPEASRVPAPRPTAPALSAAIPAVSPTPDAIALATPVVVAPPRAAVARASETTPVPTRRPRPTAVPEVASLPAVDGGPAAAAAPPPPPRPPREASGGRTYAGAATLPGGARIELGGIVWSETEPRALVNDRILGTGGYVEGWSIRTIEEDRIVLEKDGATVTITVK